MRNTDALHPVVQEAIDNYAKYYAEQHKLGLSIRDDMRYVAQVATRWANADVNDKIVSVTRGFDPLGNGINRPWVQVFFGHDEWKYRDDFANSTAPLARKLSSPSALEEKEDERS